MNNKQLTLAAQIGGDGWWETQPSFSISIMGHYLSHQKKAIGVSGKGFIYLTENKYIALGLAISEESEKYRVTLEEAQRIMRKECKLEEFKKFA